MCIRDSINAALFEWVVENLMKNSLDALQAVSYTHLDVYKRQTLLRVIGGIFVVIVGVYIFAQSPVPQIRRNRTGKTSLWQDFASIFGLTIANFIMVITYILAFFAVFKLSGGDITHEGVGGFFRAMFILSLIHILYLCLTNKSVSALTSAP